MPLVFGVVIRGFRWQKKCECTCVVYVKILINSHVIVKFNLCYIAIYQYKYNCVSFLFIDKPEQKNGKAQYGRKPVSHERNGKNACEC